MTTPQPHVVAIAGPNGAGKSTTAPRVLSGTLHVEEFVNADVIARGLSAFNAEAAAFEAGRIMLGRLDELARQRRNFAFETTLASRTFAPKIDRLRRRGYLFHLVFVWVPNSDFAVNRVLSRVRSGGHNIPEETIRRRYRASIDNFFNLYRPLADMWRFYDNSQRSGPRLLAAGVGGFEDTVADAELWQAIRVSGMAES